MAKRHPKNQLPLNFEVSGNRIVLALGEVENEKIGDLFFHQLIHGERQLEPAGEMADISNALNIIHQIGHKLPYPEGMKIAQLHHVSEVFKGFSAIYNQKGWIFLNSKTEKYERNYQAYLLTASLGLNSLYTSLDSLKTRSEHLIFQSLLPFKEVESFFRPNISKMSGSLASDIVSFFNVPFPIVLKRAHELSIISDKQYRNFTNIKPVSHVPSLFVSNDVNMDDLESGFSSNNN